MDRETSHLAVNPITVDPRIIAAVQELGLTARQREITTAIALGYDTKSLAKCLHVSSAALRTHFRNIFITLGVQSRVELVSRALTTTLAVIDRARGPAMPDHPPHSSLVPVAALEALPTGTRRFN